MFIFPHNNVSYVKFTPVAFIFVYFWTAGNAAPQFVTSPINVEVTEGEDASFECSIVAATGDTMTISWYKDDELIPADDNDFRQSFDGRLARLDITGTYLDDAAVYRCVATTDKGVEASTTGTLKVNGKSFSDVVAYWKFISAAHFVNLYQTAIIYFASASWRQLVTCSPSRSIRRPMLDAFLVYCN